MKIDFGYKKVAIYSGTLKKDNKIGVCELQKLLEPENYELIGDSPCTMYFHNIHSLDVLIHALEGVRLEMLSNEAEK